MNAPIFNMKRMCAILLIGLLTAANLSIRISKAEERNLSTTANARVESANRYPSTGIPERLEVIFDMQVTAVASGWEVSWSGRLPGDYNQDGKVDISDITPLAMHWQEEVIDYPELEAVDGSGNGVVDIADITMLAMNYGITATGYIISFSDGQSGPFEPAMYIGYEDYVTPLSGFRHYLKTAQSTRTTGYLQVWFCASDVSNFYECAEVSLQ